MYTTNIGWRNNYRPRSIHETLRGITSLDDHPHIRSEFVEVFIRGYAAAMTERGVLIEDDGDYESYWLPIKHIKVLQLRVSDGLIDGEYPIEGPIGACIVPIWLAKKHPSLRGQLRILIPPLAPRTGLELRT